MSLRTRIEQRLAELAAVQQDVVARWQLVDADAGRGAVRAAERVVAVLRRLHDGVYLAGHAPPTAEQRWWGAVLTAPATALSHASAAALHGLWPWPRAFETVTRPGHGGARRSGDVLVHYSTMLEGWVTDVRGIRVTTVERTLIDLSPHVGDVRRRKLLREALRLRLVTIASMQRALAAHRGRRGTVPLARLVGRYALLQLDRCRSDAEARAMEVLLDAGLVLPDVNVDRAGIEADLSWESLRLIIEIDGPGFHVLTDEDARKTAAWEAAGWRVRRIGSDVVFRAPEELVALALRAGVPRRRGRRPHFPG